MPLVSLQGAFFMKKKKPIKARNIHAMNPLMKKGGAHVKSKSSQRSKEKMKLKRGEYD